ncbi:MAG: hypothetical protein GY861_27090 [bacterium]|nr:hypothetical protein [bacterium]
MKTKTQALIVVMVVAVLMLSATVRAAPIGPDGVTVSPSEWRMGQSGAPTVPAEGGNVTQILISGNVTTNYWQGYFGNVSGQMVLTDADNMSMYSWNMSEPTGEIYAANFTVSDWTTVQCVNFSQTDDYIEEHAMNLSILETYYNIPSTSMDGIDETFNWTYDDVTGFQVGTVTINEEDNCPLVYTQVNSEHQQTDFPEVLLTDNVSAVIYTAIIDQDTTGFDGQPWDFQMMVNEDGTTEGVKDYYFYVELA